MNRSARVTIMRRFAVVLILLASALHGDACRLDAGDRASGSIRASSNPDAAANARDGDRFAVGPDRAWFGRTGDSSWVWEIEFPGPTRVGAILQVHGSDPTILRDAPGEYEWQWRDAEGVWWTIAATRVHQERRWARVHRFESLTRVWGLRMVIHRSIGTHPVLREVEFHEDPGFEFQFPPLALVVSTLETPALPGPGNGFVSLARDVDGYSDLQFQHIWLDAFEDSFLDIEPRPLCAFMTGNFRDWCEVPREPWRGTLHVVSAGRLPIWAACGGAQGLGILADVGVDDSWDCPHCRDPKNPKLRIYSHIGHTGKTRCGDYSACVGERGRFQVLQVASDPVLAGLPREFPIMESHVGQLEYVPAGWTLISTKGNGGLTTMQCMRVADRPIYAAQFHMEMDGTPENSRRLMSNFLRIAREWGGYNPTAIGVAPPMRF